jgi:hypothetical protein
VEETLERLAFDLSLRALERQERVVEELRARTGLAVDVREAHRALAYWHASA